MGFHYRNATEPLRRDSVLFTTKLPEILGAHLINLERMKGWVDLENNQLFWTWDPPNLSSCSSLVFTKHKLKPKYVKLTQLWPLTVNSIKASS